VSETTGDTVQFPDDNRITGTDIFKQAVKLWSVLDGRLLFHENLIDPILVEGINL
jgi:hypothetical protein